jgi:DNA polymerase I
MQVQTSEKISSMPPSMLVSATYDNVSRSAMLKFYDPKSEKLILWLDEIGHKPYCYSKLELDELDFLQERDDILKIERVKRHDLIKDENIDISKITVSDPLTIGGTTGEKSIRNVIETWESDIKYYENYLYDRSLMVGKYYEVVDGKIKPHDLEISDEVKIALKSLLWDKVDSESMVDSKEFKECITDWAELLNQPIPKIKRLSVDIEVEAEIGRIPDPKIAEKKVTAVGFKGTDGFDQIFVLRTEDTEEGTNELDENVKVVFYDKDKEKEMIFDAFKVMEEFPFVLTYNGDEFDLPYLYNRAERLGIKKEDNPLYMMRDSATLKHGVHIDLYRTLSNRSFQIYAFSQSYTDFSLNSVSKALLGKEKIDYGLDLSDLNLYQTANYCFNDALITYELTSFNHDLLMNLLVIIARIGRMPIDDIARLGVSQWIRSLLYYEHRQRNALIPKREDLQRRSEGVMSEAVIKDKKYRGGLVVEPKEGIHFDVVVMDFASLYPSIIKVKNLSYETVRCSHEECKKNTIPQTNHWACTKRNGLTAIIIGSLRDLRVNYYKSLSKKETLSEEQRQQYTVVSQALKVILNASYGVMGAEIFPLYFLPAAEATTAIGRHTILETIKKNQLV